MDYKIVFYGFSSFVAFFVFHLAVLRILGSSKILKGLIYSICISSVFHLLLNLNDFNLTVLLISYFIFLLLTVVFVWGFLGLVTTSLRIQFLTEIAKAGDKGITYSQLLQKYNRDIIFKTRLKRLLDAGEIRESKGGYTRTQRLSYFTFHLFLLKLLNRLYKKNQYGL